MEEIRKKDFVGLYDVELASGKKLTIDVEKALWGSDPIPIWLQAKDGTCYLWHGIISIKSVKG